MDPFHVVSLAGDKLDECRRRVQRAITGRRGRAGDRLYRARRTLHTGAGLLTDAQAERLEALFADDRHAAVQAAWGVYQRLIQAYRTEDPGLGKYLMQRLIDSLRQAIPDGLEEIQALAKTLTERASDILAYFDQPRTSNGPTEAINGRLEHLRGIALGFAQPHQLHHPQPHPHRTPQRPPDNNHLNQPISPTYHTLKREEPGLRGHGRRHRHARGIIPARAGFTPSTHSQQSATRDHPRSRGVYDLIRCSNRSTVGSSPLARGLPLRGEFGDGGVRIIPARAGFTGLRGTARSRRRDHPRSRGVYRPVHHH